MTRSNADMVSLIETKLQSASTADWSTAEKDYQIEECLKEFSTYHPHLVDVVLKIEGRYGTVSSTSANNLVDTTKGQFVAADATNEKVIHNTTENKRAVVLTQASTAQVGLSADIMTKANAQYEIYNRFCWNHKQVFIGDVPEYNEIHSVEYPIGTRRNFKVYDRVLEIDKDNIPDTNANTAKVTNLPDDDILVRFNMPHQLSQLTDWVGVVASSAAAAATAISGSTFQASGTLEVGSEFNIENHKTTYIVTATAAIATTVLISIYPPLEAAAASTWAITFRKSSLEPQFEENFADLAASRLAINKAPKFFNAISLGGGVVYQNFLTWGERRLGETLSKLRRGVPPKTTVRYPTD